MQHPLIAYSILAAKESKLITRITVNTDSEEIAETAKKYGAEIPFMRPADLGGDLSRDYEVFIHALEWFAENENYRPDFVVQLRPTSPVRMNSLIDSCLRRLTQSDADSIRVVTQSSYTPFKMWKVDDESQPMTPLLTLDGVNEPYNEPRQKLPAVYWQIGTLDVIRTSTITEKKSMSGSKILPFIIDPKYAIDIDDVTSFYKAEEVIQYSDCIKFDE